MNLRKAARVALPLYLGAIYATLGIMRRITETLRGAGLLRISVAVAFTLAAVGAGVLIGREPLNRSRRVLGAMAGCAAVYAAIIWPMESPEEKLHFIEYGLVALLADLAAPTHWGAKARFVRCALFVTAAGWGDELLQGLLPHRYYDLRDVAFNAVAGLLALSALALVRFVRTSVRPTPASSLPHPP
ncbi:MAG: VanZ family protein [Myxococcaceae bacterium]|nr:VanZ family protein [Myxococcaceae bacterium]